MTIPISSLKDKIPILIPRENSGSNSSSRFDYQKDWSLCRLIELHQCSQDYLLIFDWHEDLVLMDSGENPRKVEFYQIKGKKSGNWTINSLIKSQKDELGNPLLSIFGKLYDCRNKFCDETASLNFVSNAVFSVSLPDKKQNVQLESVCLLDLNEVEQKKITDKLKEEHPTFNKGEFVSITNLKTVSLSLDDSATHAKGVITNLLELLYPNENFNISSIYRSIFDEIRRKANYSKSITSFSELVAKKAIGRSEFSNMLNAVTFLDKSAKTWERVMNDLDSCSVPFIEKKKINDGYKKLKLEQLDPTNNFLSNLWKAIEFVRQDETFGFQLQDLNFHQCIIAIYNEVHRNNNIPPAYDKHFVLAMISIKLYE
ncbi:DUF4297 domain-containing protein [Chitinophaga pinensis]|uniref:CD-NTase associated protein 4-like DNA endonuclease domain-containing protein n=1 Tax=Chitinophaga pinensis (strain ATCC 43595 / DSM 2588 / LMG 13176 / NBRC 15968 / NCIMB 11800 / UQM 2034) TaxID=485918 RepID=A0A979G556_CHIPD|nr:DUF4297 domain-containing protein [Chitinophaga pinensis]ACU60972.1 hypothetical protein Cpin_3508 [Chitinophaga pinensis DSM 2588]